MSTEHFELADAQTIEEVSDVGYRIPVRAEFGAQDLDDDVRFVYRKETETLYALVATQDGEFAIYRERSWLRNSWQQVGSWDGYGSAGGANIGQPFVTREGTLLIPHQGEASILRSEDWGETEPTEVYSRACPLTTRHAQDVFGDIFFAEYVGPSAGNHALIRSSDDGRTWTTVATQLGSSHMHFAVPSPTKDVVVWSSSHDDEELEICRKDGSDHGTAKMFGPHGEPGQDPGCALPLPNISETTLHDGAEVFLFGSDDTDWAVHRSYAGLDSNGDATTAVQYQVGNEPKMERQPFIADLEVVDGCIVGIARTGQLWVSPDGWFWDTINVTPTGFTDKFHNFMTETPNHVVIDAIDPVAIPKSRLYSVDPKRQSYLFKGQTGEIPPESNLIEGIPLRGGEKLKIRGFGSGALDAVISAGGLRHWMEAVDFGGQRAAGEVELVGEYVERIENRQLEDGVLQFAYHLLKE